MEELLFKIHTGSLPVPDAFAFILPGARDCIAFCSYIFARVEVSIKQSTRLMQANHPVNQQSGVLSRRLEHEYVLMNSMRSKVHRQIAAWKM